MSEWRECKLGEICKIKGGKRLPRGELLTTFSNTHPYIRVRDLGTKKVALNSTFGYVPDVIFPIIKNYITNTDDIIISIVGTVGLIGVIDKSLNNASLTENCVKLIFDKKTLNKDFLYSYLTSSIGQAEIEKGIVGSTQPKLPIYNIQNINILLPSIPEQEAIAEILSSLDDKIDLLNRQNKTLEALAETYFRQWFIEEADEEWTVGRLGDEFNIIMGQSPEGKTYNETKNGLMFFQGKTDFDFRFPVERIYCSEPIKIAQKFDTLLSVRAPVGALNMAFCECCIGRGLAVPLQKTGCKHYTFYKMKSLKEVFDTFDNDGTVFGSISRDKFKMIETALPPQNLVEKFDSITDVVDNKIYANTVQIQTLQKLRDTLLPKLISGEVKVKM